MSNNIKNNLYGISRFQDALETVRRWHYEPNSRIPASLIKALICSGSDFNFPIERNGAFITTIGGNDVLAVAVKDDNGNVIAYDIWNNPFDV